MHEKPIKIDPTRNHWRVPVVLVVEAPSGEQAIEKVSIMLEQDFLKDFSIDSASEVFVHWVER